jgi:hypothetical protein
MYNLDEDAAGMLILQAQASGFKRAATSLRNFRFVTPIASNARAQGAETRDEIAAISTATGQLADGLAAMLLGAPGPR